MGGQPEETKHDGKSARNWEIERCFTFCWYVDVKSLLITPIQVSEIR